MIDQLQNVAETRTPASSRGVNRRNAAAPDRMTQYRIRALSMAHRTTLLWESRKPIELPIGMPHYWSRMVSISRYADLREDRDVPLNVEPAVLPQLEHPTVLTEPATPAQTTSERRAPVKVLLSHSSARAWAITCHPTLPQFIAGAQPKLVENELNLSNADTVEPAGEESVAERSSNDEWTEPPKTDDLVRRPLEKPRDLMELVRTVSVPATKVTPTRATAIPRVLPPYLAKAWKTKTTEPKRTHLRARLAIASSVLVAGLYFGHRSFNTPQTTADQIVQPDSQASGGSGREVVADTPSVAFIEANRSALENQLRPANLLETMGLRPNVELKKVSDVQMQSDGKPITVHVVLYARLNEKTERRWRDAGFFKNDGNKSNPFLRKITISRQCDLDLLLDWHIEGILIKPSAFAPKI